MSILRQQRFVFFIIVSVFSCCLFSAKGFASWDCFKIIHKEAISDAINISPTELKNILKSYEASMRKQVDYIQNEPPSNRKSYESYYKDIVEIAKEKDLNRYEYMGRLFTDITIYAFSKYCPIQVSLCDENKILKRTTVIFDGYDTNFDYIRYSKSYVGKEHSYTAMGQDPQMLEFYNILVNEIIDLWVTIWKDSGRDISGMPKENTLVRGTVKTKETKKEDVAKTSISLQDPIHTPREEKTRRNTAIQTDNDLNKYN